MSTESLGVLFREVGDLRTRVEDLCEQLAQLTTRLSVLEQQPRVLINNTLSSPGAAAALPSASSAAPPGVPPDGPHARARPTFYVRKYYVVVAGTAQPGVFITFSSYSDQVRDEKVDWNGRGKIPFKSGIESQAFQDALAAENWYRQRTNLGEDQPVPYWY